MNFFARLAAELLIIAPSIIQDIYADKASMSNESKLQAATTATMQASQVAGEIDPADTDKINDAEAVTKGIITAFQAQPPAQQSQAPAATK